MTVFWKHEGYGIYRAYEEEFGVAVPVEGRTTVVVRCLCREPYHVYASPEKCEVCNFEWPEYWRARSENQIPLPIN